MKSTLTESKNDETITSKRTRKNHRDNQKQDYSNSKRHQPRRKDSTIDVSANAKDNCQEEQKEPSIHDDDIIETQQRQDQV